VGDGLEVVLPDAIVLHLLEDLSEVAQSFLAAPDAALDDLLVLVSLN
jgi:hypothetical protein